MKRPLLFLFLLFAGTFAVAQTDSLDADGLYISFDKMELKEVTVSERRMRPMMEVHSPSQMQINIEELEALPKFLGQSDPLRYLHTVAGVQTNNEAVTGIFIQGCEDAHTLVSINGAPVFYPNHLLGLFSGFIPAHLQSMNLVKSAHDAAFANRLGGEVALQTAVSHTGRRVSADINAGLISADATLKIACSPKSELLVSGRASYINLIYGKLLSMGGASPGYGFQDANLTYAWRPSSRDEVVFTGYFGNDRLFLNTDSMTTSLHLKWQNLASSAYWNRTLEDGNMRTTLFCSGFNNNFGLISGIKVIGASDHGSTGINHTQTRNLKDGLALDFGGTYTLHLTAPLWFETEGWNSHVPHSTGLSHEAELFAGVKHEVNDVFSYSAGLHGGVFCSGGKVFFNADPRVSFSAAVHPDHILTAHAGLYTQNLHRISLVDGGFPIDFWMTASRDFKPERAHSAGLGYAGHFFDDKMVITVEGYYKQLFNVIESNANLIKVVTGGFSYTDALLTGTGRNYGLDIMVQKTKGSVRGYISYSLGWARRKMESVGDYYFPAVHERRHNLVAVINYRINKSWNLGATFVLASGTPYTAADHVYLINGQLIADYGTWNGANLPLTHRLDLSCDYTIIKKNGYEFGLNLSLYNVYARKNIQFIVVSTRGIGTYGISLLGTVIPSLSLFFKC